VHSIGCVDGDRDPSGRRLGLQARCRGGQRLTDVERPGLGLRGRVLLELGQGHHVVDEVGHAPCVVDDASEEAFAGLGVVRRSVLQRLRHGGDRRQRCPQLVAGVGHEVLAGLLEPVSLCHIAERDHDTGGLACVPG